MLYSLIRPFLFLLPAEAAHHFTLKTLSLLYKAKLYPRKKINSSACKTVMGLSFPSMLGLAAGLDKNGEHIDALSALGFGFIEVGTVTPRPQPGNAKPRLFRIPKSAALINRMGFNNKGVDYLISQIQKTKFNGILGINIGKNATTPIEYAVDDYCICLKKVYPYASYITINISSPNTLGLRTLQQSNYLDTLLSALKTAQHACEKIYKRYVPLVIKISPDLTTAEIKEVAATLLKNKMDGVIATNTTLSRKGVENLPCANETGGLSGTPLFSQALHTVHHLKQTLNNDIPIIACGGISSLQQATQMLDAGASLIQIYTGLIYQGTDLITKLRNLNSV
jgi:dihydroorotate dehydrogenase